MLLFYDWFSVGVSNTKYQISNALEGMDNDKRLGEKNEISLSLSPSPPLPLPLSVCVRICTYIGRYSLPISHSHSHIQNFKSQPLQSQPSNYTSYPYDTFTQNRIFLSSHPMHTFTYVLYCTVSTTCRQYLRYVCTRKLLTLWPTAMQ